MKSVYEIILKLSGGPQTQASLEQTEGSINMITQAATAAGVPLAQAGQAMMDVSQRAAEANAQFERGITNMTAIMGVSRAVGDEYADSLSEVLERTGRQVSMNDALTASYDAASAGYTEAADSLGLMESSMTLAIAGTSGLDQSTDNLQDAQIAVIVGMKNWSSELESYGDTAAQAARVSDVLYNTIKLGITDVKQLAPQFAEIAPAAAAAGLAMEEVAGAYAVVTSKGVKATQTTTGMKAALSALGRGGGTQEAKDMIRELGIDFSLAAVESKGFIGVLKEMDSVGLNTYESLLTLTGTDEGAAFFSNLLADVDKTAEAFGTFNQELDSTASIASLKATDSMGRLTAAANRFDEALARAGANLKPVNTELKGLATLLLEAFNDAPDWLQAGIGNMVSLGGVAASAGGNLLQVASNIAVARLAYAQYISTVASAAAAQTSAAASNTTLSASLVGTSGAAKGAAGAMGLLNLSLAPILAPILAATAAIAGLTAAYLHWGNVQAEKEANQEFEALASTEALTQETSKLVLKMRESGEAIPDAQYRDLVARLKEADEGTGALTGITDALVKVQGKAADGSLKTEVALAKKAEATRAATQATESGVKATVTATDSVLSQQAALEASEAAVRKQAAAEKTAAEQAAKLAETRTQVTEALNNGISESADAFQAFESKLASAVTDGTVTLQQSFQARAQALAELGKAQDAAYSEAISGGLLEAQKTKELEAQKTKAQRDSLAQRLQLQRDWVAELRRVNDQANEIELLQIEEQAYRQGWTQSQLTEALRTAKAQQLTATVETVKAELAAVTEGSAKQRSLYLDLYRAKNQLAKETGGLAREATEAQTEVVESEAAKQQRAAEERAQEEQKLWADGTQALKLELDTRAMVAQAAGARIQAALSAQSQMGGIKGDSLGLYEQADSDLEASRSRVADLESKILELKTKALETGAQDVAQVQALEAARDKELATQALISKERESTLTTLREQGISIEGSASAEERAFQVAQVKLNLELEALALKVKQTEITTQLQILEQDRLVLELQRQAAAKGTTEAEARNLEAQIENARQQKALLAESLAQAEAMARLEMQNTVQGARIDLAAQGIDPGAIGAEFQAANDRLSQALGQTFSAELGTLGIKTTEGASTVAAAVGALEGSLGSNLANVTSGVVNPLAGALGALQGATESGSQQVVASNQAAVARLGSLEQAVRSLPSQIAAAIPRPAPAPRGK